MEHQILLAQRYSSEDDRSHYCSLLPYFKDPRYIRVAGRPLFLVYRLGQLPQPAETIRLWRQSAIAAGLPGLYLCAVESLP